MELEQWLKISWHQNMVIVLCKILVLELCLWQSSGYLWKLFICSSICTNAIFGTPQIRRFSDLGSVVIEVRENLYTMAFIFPLKCCICYLELFKVSHRVIWNRPAFLSAQRNQQNFPQFVISILLQQMLAIQPTYSHFSQNEFNYLQYQSFVSTLKT